MSISSITTSVLSSLGNNTGSVIPIATKDLIQNQVLVAEYAKKGGKYDAFEKFVEENGTSAIWLGGLPLIKKLFDKTIYKLAGISSDVDIRKLKEGTSDSTAFAINKLKEQIAAGKAGNTATEQLKALNSVASHKNLAKGLFVGKFAAATALTMAALAGIITYKQKHTKQKAEQNVKLKVIQENILKQNVRNTDVHKMFMSKMDKNTNDTGSLAFKGGIGNALSAFMYNPVLNQMILDGGITGLRAKTARKGERRDVLIKEAFEIACLYPRAVPIQTGFDLLFGKMFGKDIGLNYAVLASERFKNSLGDGSMKDALSDLVKNVDIEKIGVDAAVDKHILNFIYDNPDNPVVKFLKDIGDVATVKETIGKKFGLFNIKQATDEIDSLAYMDTKAIQSSIEKLMKMVSVMNKKGAVGNMDKALNYLKGAQTAKGLSIVSAIAFGIWAMGILQTNVVLKLREKLTGSTENEAITNLEKQIRHQMAFEGNNNSSNALKTIA